MITTLHNQSLLDIACSQYGDATAAIALAIANGQSLTAAMDPGTELVELEGFVPDRGTLRLRSVTATKQAYKAVPKQNCLDIAMQLSGDTTEAIHLAIANELGITADIAPAQEIDIEQLELRNESLVNFLKGQGIVIATGDAIVEQDELVGNFLLTDDGLILLTDDNNRLIYE